MTIGERIKFVRKQAGMTQQELADRLETSYEGITLWESVKSKPKPESLMRIAEVLDIPATYFTENGHISEQELLDFISWAWPRADYQATVQQHSEGAQEEVERWERVCEELHKLHDDVVAEMRIGREKQSKHTDELLQIYEQLNAKGKRKLMAWAKDFSKIPEYQLPLDSE